MKIAADASHVTDRQITETHAVRTAGLILAFGLEILCHLVAVNYSDRFENVPILFRRPFLVRPVHVETRSRPRLAKRRKEFEDRKKAWILLVPAEIRLLAHSIDTSEPLMSEYCAAYLGEDAYRQERV